MLVCVLLKLLPDFLFSNALPKRCKSRKDLKRRKITFRMRVKRDWFRLANQLTGVA